MSPSYMSHLNLEACSSNSCCTQCSGTKGLEGCGKKKTCLHIVPRQVYWDWNTVICIFTCSVWMPEKGGSL